MDRAWQAGFRELGFGTVTGMLSDRDRAAVEETYERLAATWRAGEPVGTAVVCPALVWIKPESADGAELLPPDLAARARSAAAELLGGGGDRITIGARMFLKPPGARGTRPHQDAAYNVRRPGERLNIWLPLEPAEPENGCLYYYPGSHRDGVVPHATDPSDPDGNTLVVTDLPRREPVAVPLRPGSAVLHHQCVIHGAHPNSSERWRRGLVLVCGRTRDDR